MLSPSVDAKYYLQHGTVGNSNTFASPMQEPRAWCPVLLPMMQGTQLLEVAACPADGTP